MVEIFQALLLIVSSLQVLLLCGNRFDHENLSYIELLCHCMIINRYFHAIFWLLADATPRHNKTFLNGTENIHNRNSAKRDLKKLKAADPFSYEGIVLLL